MWVERKIGETLLVHSNLQKAAARWYSEDSAATRKYAQGLHVAADETLSSLGKLLLGGRRRPSDVITRPPLHDNALVFSTRWHLPEEMSP